MFGGAAERSWELRWEGIKEVRRWLQDLRRLELFSALFQSEVRRRGGLSPPPQAAPIPPPAHTHPALGVLSCSSTGSSCKTGSRWLTTRSQLLLFVWKISGFNGSISTVTLVSFPAFHTNFFLGPGTFCCRLTCVPLGLAA